MLLLSIKSIHASHGTVHTHTLHCIQTYETQENTILPYFSHPNIFIHTKLMIAYIVAVHLICLCFVFFRWYDDRSILHMTLKRFFLFSLCFKKAQASSVSLTFIDSDVMWIKIASLFHSSVALHSHTNKTCLLIINVKHMSKRVHSIHQLFFLQTVG